MKKMILASAFFCGMSVANAQVSVSASDVYSSRFAAEKAVDGDLATRWATTGEVAYPVTFELSYSAERSVSKIAIDEWFDKNGKRVQKFEIAYKKGNKWVEITTGTTIGKEYTIQLPKAVKTKNIRLTILESLKPPTINEIVVE